MTLTIQPVALTQAAQAWPLAERHILEAIPHSNGDYTLDQVKLYVNTGVWLLLVAVDENNEVHGAATVVFQNYPNDRVGFITFIGGKLISNPETFDQLCAILKAHGATKIQGMARPAIARLWARYGFEERVMLVEAKL